MKILRDPMLLLLLSLLLAWGVYEGGQPPEVKAANTPDSVFSAVRAEAVLQRLYIDNKPHVAGSAANAEMRDRIISTLESFGYAPEIQSRFHCRPDIGWCSPVENIIAVHQGRGGDSAILLTAHYDSGWAGPGVSDDGAGVAAILEMARMAAQQGEFEYSLMFLLTDGEEMGLIGADAFARHNPLFERVKAVINLEARGSTGASVMFESGPGNRGIIRMLAKNLERPVANSLTEEVYRRMPNDTDFSVYRNYDLPGVNFAFTQGASIYHSQIDDLLHLDRGSLQHHGQNAWSMVQAMDERDLERITSSEQAAYIDLFGRKLLHYPLSSAAGLALVLSVLVLAAINRSFARQIRFRELLWTFLGSVLLLIAVPAMGWLLSWPLGHWVDTHALEHPFPWVGQAALVLAVIWAFSMISSFLAPRVSTASVMAGSWGLLVVISLVLAYKLPVAGYLGVLPLLSFCIGLLLDGFRWKKQPRLIFASLFGYLAAAYIGFYFFLQLDVVLNFKYSMLKIAPLLFPALAALPLLASFYEARISKGKGSPNLAFLFLIAAICGGQYFIPGYTFDTPRDMTLMARMDEGRPSTLLVLESSTGSVDKNYARNHGFAPVSLPQPDGPPRELLAQEIPDLGLPVIAASAKEEQGSESGSSSYLLDIEIPEGLEQLVVSFHKNSELRRAVLNDQLAFDAEQKSSKRSGFSSIVVNHPESGPMQIELQYAGKAPSEWMISGRFPMPEELWTRYAEDWPATAQPAFRGPRVITSQTVKRDN